MDGVPTPIAGRPTLFLVNHVLAAAGMLAWARTLTFTASQCSGKSLFDSGLGEWYGHKQHPFKLISPVLFLQLCSVSSRWSENYDIIDKFTIPVDTVVRNPCRIFCRQPAVIWAPLSFHRKNRRHRNQKYEPVRE